MVLAIGFMFANLIKQIIKKCVFLLPCNPLPPSTKTYIHHTHASAETGFSIFYMNTTLSPKAF
jgi:hypothetical protein